MTVPSGGYGSTWMRRIARTWVAEAIVLLWAN
jgi:hypothetical protein